MEEDDCGGTVAGGGWSADKQIEAAVIILPSVSECSASLDHCLHPHLGDGRDW